MATLPAPRTSIQKCQIIERQFFVQPFKIFFLAQFCTLFVILTLFQGFVLVFVLYKISFASGDPGKTDYVLSDKRKFVDERTNKKNKKTGPFIFHKVYDRCERNCSVETGDFHSMWRTQENLDKCCNDLDDGFECNPKCQKVRI